MPWTFYNANGQRLSSAATNISVLDIDGATDIGAPIANGDLLIIDDGAGGANRKTTVDRLKTYIGTSAVSLNGSQTSEATSTATSAADMLTSSTLDIAAAEEFQYIVGGRKTSGAVDNAALGIKINTTVTGEALAATPARTWGSSTANVAQSGGGQGWFGSRVSNYQGCSGGNANAFGASGGNRASGSLSGLCESAVVPIATVTAVVIRGITDNASNTLGSDELHVYKFVTS
jgi:hypothetical protein